MNLIASHILLLLKIAAMLQLGVAILNLFLIRLLDWRQELARVPLLMREVFQVHVWFISITLAIFGVLTWRFAGEIASGQNPVAQWLAGGIGIFWAVRTVLQFTYYSASHWRGQVGRTLAHVCLLLMYGGFGLLYLYVAVGGSNFI
jgi:hypothetical protein